MNSSSTWSSTETPTSASTQSDFTDVLILPHNYGPNRSKTMASAVIAFGIVALLGITYLENQPKNDD